MGARVGVGAEVAHPAAKTNRNTILENAGAIFDFMLLPVAVHVITHECLSFPNHPGDAQRRQDDRRVRVRR